MKNLSSAKRNIFDKEMGFMERIKAKKLKRSVMVYEQWVLKNIYLQTFHLHFVREMHKKLISRNNFSYQPLFFRYLSVF